ncbi:ABC-type phosphate transport system substrate-binding protein [Catenuloplanes nepalensis]|uniref:ABC-type phosphate transport system substrate-binding protein n=1 Tax=Catenuloplanes nepalensis TaxID=587533 RepID=A0ABT9N1U4_9ACTN|nr:hypothetical protein [Catenuloplanes nepalensis]MDP9797241.1 ABC-type phosphate transport system substrate-binding protein [Catenuloplanes nepalensis]
MTSIRRLTAALVLVPAVLAVVAGPAAADPPPPTGASYCAVGSETMQAVMQRLAGTVRSVSGKTFESWHATGSSTITTSCAPGAFPRPGGSTDGTLALRDSKGLNTGPVPDNAISFARSWRGPVVTGDALQFVPFGVDAVAPAVRSGGLLDRAFPNGLSFAMLQSIYNCTTTTVTVGGETRTIRPYVPGLKSDTRNFFLYALNLHDTVVNTTCVRDTKLSGEPVPENDGTVLTDPAGVVEIVPMSIASIIAQTDHVVTGVEDRRGGSKPMVVAGAAPIVNGAINPAWPVWLQQKVYNAFPRRSVAGAFADSDLVSLFVGVSSMVCTDTATLHRFGFRTASDCGSLSVLGNY